jgi:hypothetical protein
LQMFCNHISILIIHTWVHHHHILSTIYRHSKLALSVVIIPIVTLALVIVIIIIVIIFVVSLLLVLFGFTNFCNWLFYIIIHRFAWECNCWLWIAFIVLFD